nr:hypothetical protein [uncultured Sphaerochaeta sp.]
MLSLKGKSDGETGETYLDETQEEKLHDPVNIISTEPVTLTFDFATS